MSAVTDECLDDLHWAPLQDIMCPLNKMGSKQRDLSFSMSVVLDDVRESEGRLGVFLLAGDPDEKMFKDMAKSRGVDAFSITLVLAFAR